ncbi:uncharacterized protein UHOD_11959 [Ustilago sp. UG-2017b]|nr:uncharacterized protein UHOD_11955 [Ustilago sp. UG-2017b]SPC64598.1 uncharacterized protein UHOD_11959 [Ustilago sp. UG-2017b]
MTPLAFKELAKRLEQTKSFNSGQVSIELSREILSVALYRLGRSGNGVGEHDASLQCDYSIGTLIAWTGWTVCGLLELNKEVMQFASEVERQSASAWVQRTTRVEEWGKGWLVVDGTHVLLAWKPGMMSREHFSYKGFYSMNIALVILPHSLCIVESVVGQAGSV